MSVSRITDKNYEDFMGSRRAVLVLSESWCPACHAYKPIVEALSGSMPYVRFGEAVLDEGHLIKLKRSYPAEEVEYLPTTVLFRDGKVVYKFEGGYDESDLHDTVRENLIVGSIVYVPGEDGLHVPRVIRKVNGDKYTLQLPSPFDEVRTVEMTESQFAWNMPRQLLA